MQTQFQNACKNGNLKLAQEILQEDPNINISNDNEHAFRWACLFRHLEVAQWLLKVKPNINISAEYEFAFRYSCEYGHLQVAQWLLQVKPNINISFDSEYAFRHACYNNYQQVAQWLQSLKPFKYSIKIENNNIIDKINSNCTENILFMLYTLKYKNYTNNLTPNLLTNISKYI